MKKLTVPAQPFAAAYAAASLAAKKKHTNPRERILSCVVLDQRPDGLRVVATDAYRLYVVRLHDVMTDLSEQVLIESRPEFVRDLKAEAKTRSGDFEITVDEQSVVVSRSESRVWQVGASRLDATYPDYDRVVGESPDGIARDVDELVFAADWLTDIGAAAKALTQFDGSRTNGHIRTTSAGHVHPTSGRRLATRWSATSVANMTLEITQMETCR